MSGENKNEVCVFCKQGKLLAQDREFGFRQWTDRGYVSCHVTVPIRVCMQCGSESFTDLAESMVEEAVRREYEKLP